MEYKHFSHVHSLAFHQMPQSTEVQCSGCKFPGSGSVYACWQCSYFLHEQCFQASRSLKHPSHPTHPLTLVPYPTYPSNSFYCNTCNLVGSGFSYCCSECEFDIHVHCAFTPNNATLGHESLSLVPYPNYSNIGYGTQNYNPQPASPMHQTAGYHSNQSNHSLNFPPNYPTPAQTSSYHESIQHNASLNPPSNHSPMPTGYPVSVQHNSRPNPPMDNFPMPDGYPGSVQHTASSNSPLNNSPMPNFNSPGNAPSTQVTVPPPAGNVPVASNNQVKPPEASPSVLQASGPVRISLLSNPSNIKEVNHFSHPHALQLNEIKDTAPKLCSGCEDKLTGSAYSCIESQCNFHLHKSCFELPREIHHESHLDHPLTLLAKPPYTCGQFACSACLQGGAAFVYNCATCSFDLHIECTSLPESIILPDHQHSLKLMYSSPVPKTEGQQEVTFICDLCQKQVHEIDWTYYCRECDFGTHLICAAHKAAQPAQKTDEELVLEAQLKLAMLSILMNGTRDAKGPVNN